MCPSLRPTARRWGLTEATVGVAVAFLLLLVAGQSYVSDPHSALLLSYLVVWVPLLAAVATARVRHFVPGVFGVHFRPIDLLWGLSIGMLGRVFASLVEIAGYGHVAGGAVTLGQPVYDAWWLFGSLIAPIVLSPVIEELFFRGLLLRAMLDAMTGSSLGRLAVRGRFVAIAASGVVFALLHVLEAGSVATAVVVGVSTLVFGLAAATVAAFTGRLGGAVIAHITFNALAVIPGLL